MLTAIYALSDPRDGKIHYIGQTQYLLAVRLGHHIGGLSRAAKRARTTYREAWIGELILLGLSPDIEVIEYVDSSFAGAREQMWIEFYRSLPGSEIYNRLKNHHYPKHPIHQQKIRQPYQAKTPHDSRLSGNSQSDLAYQWLIENDPGWEREQVPSARTIVSNAQGISSTGSATRGRDIFIRDFKS